jgi:hypothetical protein
MEGGMDVWTWAHRRAGAAIFTIQREPYKHRDGTQFDFLLTITRRDGARYDMRVKNVEDLTGLIEELVPDNVLAVGPDAAEILAAIEDRRPSDTTVH